jgi:hypothetical protein
MSNYIIWEVMLLALVIPVAELARRAYELRPTERANFAATVERGIVLSTARRTS